MTTIGHFRDFTDASDQVYVGRRRLGHDGYFGSPVVRGKRCPECGQVHYGNGRTLPCFRAMATRRLARDAVYARRVAGLDGKHLFCFCWPEFPCHAEVLIELIPLAQKICKGG